MNHRRWLQLSCLLAGAVTALAQLPSAKLAGIFPVGLRAGTTNELAISGSDLEGPAALRFSDARIVATPKAGSTTAFTVAVPAEVPPGIVDVRFAGRFGVSNPRALAIGDRPESVGPSTNTTPETAALMPLGSVVDGRIAANTASWFRFTAKAGQRVIVRVEARVLDSRLEPVLAAFGAGQSELARARRGLLDFIAPVDGVYLLRLQDQTFRGGDDFAYRLTLSAGPHLDFALPNVLRAGRTNRVTLHGRNLPGGTASPFTGVDGRGLDQLGVDIVAPDLGDVPADLLRRPAAAVLAGESIAWSLAAPEGRSNPLLFTLTTNAVTPSAADGLAKITPPGEFSGLFPKRGGRSGVTFEAKKGEVLWLEIWGERLGPVCDPFALLQRVTKGPKGEEQAVDLQEFGDTDVNVGGRDFNTTTRDPVGRIEIKEDGLHRVLVRDLFNTGTDSPRHPYRLSLRRETPDFRLVALPQPPPKTKDDDRQVHAASASLRRGETSPLRVLVFRRDGFNGEIEITATDLPVGVTSMPGRIAEGQGTGTVLLTASDVAASSVAAIQVVGRSGSAGAVRVHPAVMATVVRPVADHDQEAIAARLAREPVLSVNGAESAPVTVASSSAGPLEAPVGGKLSVPVGITRRGDFPAAFKLKPAGHPSLDKAAEANIAEKATNGVVEINLAEAKLPEGVHTLWLQGTVAGKYRDNPEALAAAEAGLKDADKALASASAAEKPALEQRKKAAEETRKAAEERAKPRDVSVPVWSRPFVVKIVAAPKPEAKK